MVCLQIKCVPLPASYGDSTSSSFLGAGFLGSKHGIMGRPIMLTLMIVLVALLSSPTTTASTSLHTTALLQGRRNMVQINSTTTSNGASNPIVMHPDNTVRVDPFDNLRKYRGGYNLTNQHYWSSTIFTGIYGYSIGVLWLLLGLAFGGYVLFVSFLGSKVNNNKELEKKNNNTKMRSSCDKQSYLWPFVIAAFFTLLAIVAVGLVLGGNAKFHSRANAVVSIIMETANEASETIYNTTGAMKDIKTTLEASNGTSVAASAASASGFLATTSQRLDSEAADIQQQASKNRKLIDKGLKIVYIVTTVIISMTLVAVIALSVIGFLKLQRPLYWLIILCWLLTVLCWIFFGLYFFLDNFSTDTCTALENFQQNPNNNSLSSILPCEELLSAKPVLSDVSAGIYKMVNEVNKNISSMQQGLPKVCNPFTAPPEYQYQPDNCPSNTIPISEIPKMLKLIACTDPNCTGGVFISISDYQTVESYTSSIQSLLNAYPGMESLIECQSVKEAFSEIIIRHCKPLKRYAQMVWAGMSFLGIVMVFLVTLWSRKALHERDNNHVSGGSTNPHSTKDSKNLDPTAV